MVTILGIDSAGVGASAAILRGGEVLSSRRALQARGQAEILMPMIDAVLGEARLEVAQLDAIGVTVGPGSFTGLRIAIAAARGLALAGGVRAIGVSSFAAIAALAPKSSRDGRALVVALDTRREDFYLQGFGEEDQPLGEPALVAAPEVRDWAPRAPLLIAGDAAARLAPLLRDRDIAVAPATEQARAEDVARLAAKLLAAGGEIAPPRPLYLRAPDTTAPRRASAP
jgi:tRNA threonylcarbamoyladenosine biosynthesis protein TsaB